MTIHDGAPSEPSGPSGPQPSAALVAVPRFRVAQLPLDVRAELAEARRALAGRRPDESDLGTALAETICSIAFLGSVAKCLFLNPESAGQGPSVQNGRFA